MPQPVPELQEILALEAQLRCDLWDIMPGADSQLMDFQRELRIKQEASLLKDVVYVKKQ